MIKHLRVSNMITIEIDGKLINRNCNDDKFKDFIALASNNDIQGVRKLFDIDGLKTEQEEKKLAIILADDRFYTDGESVFRKGINLSIPEVVLNRFVESYDDVDEFNKVDNFWFRCAMNPNANSRESLYNFLSKNDIRLTPSGFMITYRWVVSLDSKVELPFGINYSLIDGLDSYLEELHSTYKRWKKSKSKIFIDSTGKMVSKGGVCTYEQLLQNLPSDRDMEYTDQHTKTMSIFMGNPVSIQRELCDPNHSKACSKGLHVAGLSWAKNNKFGDTKIVALVDPMNIVSVPNYDAGKMRTCEYFPCFTVSRWTDIVEDDLDLAEYESAYYFDILSRTPDSFKLDNKNEEELQKHILMFKETNVYSRLEEIRLSILNRQS